MNIFLSQISTSQDSFIPSYKFVFSTFISFFFVGDTIYCQFINDESDLGFGFKKENNAAGRIEGFFDISHVVPADEGE